MTGIDKVQLKQVIVHKIGNPSRGEGITLSENPLTLNDDIVQGLLVKYFLGAINENEQYQFTHLSDLHLNEAYTYVTRLFETPETFIPTSVLLAKFLHSKSTHVRVKEGELYIVQLGNVPFGGEAMEAVGIFKSESKESFLKVFTHGKSLEVIHEEGIHPGKPDKGCVVFRTNKKEGYTVCIADNAGKQGDAQYWIKDFLQVQPLADSYNNTDKYLGLCKQFITHKYADKFDVSRTDQIDLLSRSMDYFKTNDQFNLQQFSTEVIHHPEVVDQFMAFKKDYETSRNFEIQDEFDIHLSAVKKQAKLFKAILKLDKNFHVYIHGRRDLIEKGFDPATGKHFYKLYFDEEA